jgi:hypothetical protein
MQFDWVLTPLAQCAFLALTLISCLALFISVKFEVAAVRNSLNKRDAAPAIPVTASTAEVTAPLETRTLEAKVPTGTELTRARRAEALRMQNTGESSATIADTLRIPRHEIELLLKIQRLVKE